MCTENETPIVVALRILEAESDLTRAEAAVLRADAAVHGLAARAAEAQQAVDICHDHRFSSSLWASANQADAALRLWTGAAQSARRAVDDARQAADTARGDYTTEQLKTLLSNCLDLVMQRQVQ
jgi:hypothetical protein